MAVMKEEGDRGKKEEAKEVSTETTRQDGARTKWGRWPLLHGSSDWSREHQRWSRERTNLGLPSVYDVTCEVSDP